MSKSKGPIVVSTRGTSTRSTPGFTRIGTWSVPTRVSTGISASMVRPRRSIVRGPKPTS